MSEPKEVHQLRAVGFTLGEQQPKRARRRKPSISRAIAQAEKGGKTVSSVVLPDGMKLTFNEQTKPDDGNDLDQWMAKHARSTERH
jgi:hypothetical protein